MIENIKKIDVFLSLFILTITFKVLILDPTYPTVLLSLGFLVFFGFRIFIKSKDNLNLNDQVKDDLNKMKTTLAGISFGQNLNRKR